MQRPVVPTLGVTDHIWYEPKQVTNAKTSVQSAATGLQNKRHVSMMISDAKPFAIRQLNSADVEDVRSIRLEAFRLHPREFRICDREEYETPITQLQSRITQGYIIGSFLESSLVGIAGFSRYSQLKLSHKGLLWGMYVRPTHRRTGIASSLLFHIIKYAKSYVEQINLSVVETNEGARRLYEQWGFLTYGVELNAVRPAPDEYLALVMMALRL
jgi:ribosomal protein S18 acetylase RimI-like enzyme